MNLLSTPSPTKPIRQPQESMSNTSFISRIENADNHHLTGEKSETPETPFEDEDPLTLCCIGNTGSGKSTFMNAVFQGKDFDTGPFKHDYRGQACTSQTSSHEL